MVGAARRAGRLSLTLVWLSRFLCVLAAMDPAALRLPYYTRLLEELVGIYLSARGPPPPGFSGSALNSPGFPGSAPGSAGFLSPLPGSPGPNFGFGNSAGDGARSAPPTPGLGPPSAGGGWGCRSAGAGVLIRWCLGGLFAHTNFPHHLFYDAIGATRPSPLRVPAES